MRFLRIFAAVSACLWTAQASTDGLQNVVTWDPYSLSVNGSRVFIFSGEFHYQRVPVPEMWLDIFEKLKANGFNTISVYFFWSYHSPKKGVYDFETAGKNVQKVFDYAKQAGIWIIARAGPYTNAETNAGSLALWGSDGSMGNLRTSDNTYYQTWLPWINQISQLLAANEITKGGPVILNQVENELTETVHSATNTLVLYMEQLEKAFRAAGITVPFTSNEKGERGQSWSTDYKDVGGAVNLYGLDSYPGGGSCSNINSGFSVLRNYYQWFANYSYTQPNFFPEFEGGAFSPWGAAQFYDQCLSEHDPAFADVYYKNNIAQRGTMQNIYMAWGGTNWGQSAAPVVYTSYDYSAPLRETRQIQDKMYQTKLVGLFTRVSSGLLKTNMKGNGTGYKVNSQDIWTWELRNPDTQAGFYVFQQNDTPTRASHTFTAQLTTSQGVVSVPNINLNGRQSKIAVTDYPFGKHTLLYASSDVLTYGVFDVDVMVFYLQPGQIGQFAFKNAAVGMTHIVYGTSKVTATTSGATTAYTYTQGKGSTAVKFSDGTLVYLLDLHTAWQFWAPPTTSNPAVLPTQQIFVVGPYLVRNASVSNGVVHVSGDSNKTTPIEIYTGNDAVQTVAWNGIRLPAIKTPWGSVTTIIPGTENRTVSLPQLTNWRSGNSLPEINPAYDDSRWTVCNHTTTLAPVAPLTLPVLYSSDYGYYAGAKVYRGYFDGTTAKAVSITASGGLAFGWNAWLNGHLIGGNAGVAANTTTSATLQFTGAALTATNNVITVVVDYHGHDETSTGKGLENPRGILGASLVGGGTFKTWKIQGMAGGDSNIDPVRGPMNEGGFFGERMGWHLPGFNSSVLPSTSSPMTGIATSGIQFYVTTFELNIASDLDAPLGVELNAPNGTIARVMIFINGYQYGKYVPQLGPQTRFPIPPGVINNKGKNTMAVSLWAQTNAGAKLSEVKLFTYGLYQTDYAFNQDWSALQPGYNSSRLQYV